MDVPDLRINNNKKKKNNCMDMPDLIINKKRKIVKWILPFKQMTERK